MVTKVTNTMLDGISSDPDDPQPGDILQAVDDGSGGVRLPNTAAPVTISVPVRQTVLSGPMDGDGRADFLDSGTGLEAVTVGVDAEPLVVTASRGFGANGSDDIIRVFDDNLSWDGLPDDEDAVFLGVNVETGALVHTTSLDYGYTHPDTPSDGDYSFLIPQMKMYERVSGSWEMVPVVFVGECETDTGDVVSEVSYAFQGRAQPDSVVYDVSSALVVSHNIGAPVIIVGPELLCVTGNASYDPGDRVYAPHGDEQGSGRNAQINTNADNLTAQMNTGVSTIAVSTKGGGGATNIEASSWHFAPIIVRSF